MPNLKVWLSSIIPDILRGRALGGLTTFLFLGQFISPFVSQPIAHWIGLGKTYSLTGILLLAVVIVLFALKKHVKSLCKNYY